MVRPHSQEFPMAYAYAIQSILMFIAAGNGFLLGAGYELNPWIAFPLSAVALVVAYISGVKSIRSLKD